jgi:hypothetical protein
MNATKLAILANIVEDTVREVGSEGAPSGPIYAALMAYGITLEEYEAVIEKLIRSGRVRRSNHVLHAVAA